MFEGRHLHHIHKNVSQHTNKKALNFNSLGLFLCILLQYIKTYIIIILVYLFVHLNVSKTQIYKLTFNYFC